MSLDRKFMYEQNILCDNAYENGNIEKAYELTKKLLEMDTYNQFLIVNCMKYALRLGDKDAGEYYYEMSLNNLRLGRNKSDSYIGVSNIVPWRVQGVYADELFKSGYVLKSEEIVESLNEFYCKIRFLKKEDSLVSEVKEIINTFIYWGYDIPFIDENIEEYYPINNDLEKLICRSDEEKSYNPIALNYNDDKDIYVLDKRIDAENIFFDSYLELDNPKDLVEYKGVSNRKAIMAFTSIKEAKKCNSDFYPRKTNLEEILKVLNEGYGEIIINPISNKFISLKKEIVEFIVDKKKK